MSCNRPTGASFCAGQGQFDLESWDSLWGLLAVTAVRKCGHQVEYFRAGRRNIRQEIAPAAGGDSSVHWEAMAREPTPAEAALLTETVERLMASLEPRHRSIVSLSLQGNGPVEVAEQIGCTKPHRTARLKRIREWLTAGLPQPDGDGHR